MRIGYLFSRFPVLSQTFCVSEMLGLEAVGAQIEVFAIHPPETLLRHAQADKLRAPVHYAPPGPVLKLREAATRKSGYWPAARIAAHEKTLDASFKPTVRARNAAYFATLIERRAIAHIHVHFANRATHTALFLKDMTGIPFSFTAHAQDFLVDLGSPALLAELCREAAFIVAVSDWSAERLRALVPDCTDKIHRVYNGLDLGDPAFTPLAPSERPLAIPIIASVGRLVGFKGFDTLLSACAELVRRDCAFQCLVAGEGPLHGDLERKIAALGLQDRVRLLGAQPRECVLELVRSAAVFALASRTEPDGACDVLPTVIAEAMACGVPVVSTHTAGIPEMVTDGVTGWLTPPDDPHAFAGALQTAVSMTPDAAAAMSSSARTRAEELFDLSKTASRLLELFVNAPGRPCNQTPPPPPPKLLIAGVWPAEEPPLAALLEKAAELEDFAVLAWRADVHAEVPASAAAGLRNLVFFPPAEILEALWLHDGERREMLARRIAELPGGIDPHDAFAMARAALWLQREGTLKSATDSLHAAGWRAMLMIALAGPRHNPVPLSVTLEAAPPLSRNAMRQLAAMASAQCVLVGSSALATKLGPPFRHYDPRRRPTWLGALEKDLLP